MAAASHIEWTDATWNPVTGCTLVSEGCRNCYAAEWAAGRLKHHPSREGLARRNADGTAKFTGEVRFNEDWLDQPLRWRKPRRIFVCAHGDLFHESVPDEWIDQVFAVMALAPQHIFQILTKRPERMREYFADQPIARRRWEDILRSGALGSRGRVTCPPPVLRNVWLGVSVEDQPSADERIPPLLQTPAALRFLSAEPLLGPVDLAPWLNWETDDPFLTVNGRAWGCQGCDDEDRCGSDCPLRRAVCVDHEYGPHDAQGCPAHVETERRVLDWVIAGGESGSGARPCHPDWIRSLRDQCAAAQVPFFFKQWGAWRTLGSDACVPLSFYPCHEFDDSTEVFRVGKAAAGCELDGRIIQQMPVSTHVMRSNPDGAGHGPARPPDTDDAAGGLGRGRGTAQTTRGMT